MTTAHRTLLCTGLLFATPALADSPEPSAAETAAPSVAPTDPETAMWDGVYARSGKTIKAGEWMGIGGAPQHCAPTPVMRHLHGSASDPASA